MRRLPLVSIVGPGGIGKSRLAQAVAHDLLPAFPDGVWLVEFAPLDDGAQVVPAAATALQRRSALGVNLAQLVEWLRGRRLLLVLDNCEHVLDAAAELVAAVRRDAPDVQLLTTSQEPLRLADEQIVRLGTLAVPAKLPLEQAQHVGALALFVARARAADPRFRLAADNLDAALDICARLDGIALAIELAAARLPLLGLDGVRARLDDRFRMLTGGTRFAMPRHQTLRAALEWSHALLTADEQTVFRRLGVFVGSFDLDSAQRVGAGGDDTLDRWAVLDILGALVDKSWVQAEDGAVPRYRLLESSRAFALERLDAAGETPLAQRAHAEAMLARFDASRDGTWLSTTDARIAEYGADFDNLKAALTWAHGVAGDASTAIALVGASAWLWRFLGRQAEGRAWLERALERVNGATPAAREARLHYAFLELSRSRAIGAERLLAHAERALVLYRQLGDPVRTCLTLAHQALLYAWLGDPARAAATLAEADAAFDPQWAPLLKRPLLTARGVVHYEARRLDLARAAWAERLAIERQLGEREMEMAALTNLVDIDFTAGNLPAAIDGGRELVAAIRRERLRSWESFALGNLSAALTAAGQLDEALQLAREALPLLAGQGATASFLEHFALLALRRGGVEVAAQVLGCVDATHARVGFRRGPAEQIAYETLRAALEKDVRAERLSELRAAGAALAVDDAARLALA